MEMSKVDNLNDDCSTSTTSMDYTCFEDSGSSTACSDVDTHESVVHAESPPLRSALPICSIVGNLPYTVALDEEGFPVMIPVAQQACPAVVSQVTGTPCPRFAVPHVMQPTSTLPLAHQGVRASVGSMLVRHTQDDTGGENMIRKDESCSDSRTTLIFRNLPNGLTRSGFVELLNLEGCQMDYTFVYLPIDFKRNAGFGYAFVNFSTHQGAQKAMQRFQGFTRWGLPTHKICEVSWSELVQGLAAHVARYKNSPIMHKSVPDEYKPVVFSKGKRINFPYPTKNIHSPRSR